MANFDQNAVSAFKSPLDEYLTACAKIVSRAARSADMTRRRFNALPGFGLTLGFTLFYLSAIVLIPFAGLVLRTFELSWADFWRLATTDRALAAYRLTFGASLIAALANAVFGSLLAWVLTRYEFPGRRCIDAIVDFPFALPTAVAGLTLANLFAANGWLGRYLVPLGI